MGDALNYATQQPMQTDITQLSSPMHIDNPRLSQMINVKIKRYPEPMPQQRVQMMIIDNRRSWKVVHIDSTRPSQPIHTDSSHPSKPTCVNNTRSSQLTHFDRQQYPLTIHIESKSQCAPKVMFPTADARRQPTILAADALPTIVTAAARPRYSEMMQDDSR